MVTSLPRSNWIKVNCNDILWNWDGPIEIDVPSHGLKPNPRAELGSRWTAKGDPDEFIQKSSFYKQRKQRPLLQHYVSVIFPWNILLVSKYRHRGTDVVRAVVYTAAVHYMI